VLATGKMEYYLAEPPFWSIQGEGLRSGCPTIFIRLAGCNATPDFWCWEWCDTKYARHRQGSAKLSLDELIYLVEARANESKTDWVCITGGEPLCQALRPLIDALKARRFKIQIETNGTLFQPHLRVDHWTVSPKTEQVVEFYWGVAKEFKWVVARPSDLKRVRIPSYFWGATILQPESNRPDAICWCLDYIKKHPRCRLGLQLHKIIGVR